jgi:hypothetical protein
MAMRKISLEEAQPGQMVTRPISSAAGVVLVQPGTALTPELLNRLRNLSIDTIWVEGLDPNAKPVEQVLQELDQRFAGHENDRLMMELKEIIAAGFRPPAAGGQNG